MKAITCRDCEATFSWEYSPGIGRPPVRCESCREKHNASSKSSGTVEVKTHLTGKDLVDRLEFNLRASGRHISQWRDKYE